MKLKTFVFLVLAVVLAIETGIQAADQEVVANVNKVGITKAEFDRNWTPYLQQRGLPGGHGEKSSPDMTALKMELINFLIDQELLYQEASHKNLRPDSKEVEAEFVPIRNRFPSPEEFLKALEQNGFTEESYREFLGKRIAIQKYVDQEISKKQSVSSDEIHDYYLSNQNQFKTSEQVRARHILIKAEAGDDKAAKEAARKKIDEILAEAKKGADFAELAKKHSECPSGPKGGDLGFFTRGRMVKPFEDAAFALKAGEISEVVETQFGYHIIKLEERQEASVVPEETVADKIQEFLLSQKINQAVQEHLAGLREKAELEILMPK